jgi:ankyrin repeat protein
MTVSGSELHEAVQTCDVETVSGLLRNGASPNVTFDGGQTPLHVAALHGKPQCMWLLLAAGSNKYPWNHRRETADLIARKHKDAFLRAQMLALLESPGVPVGDQLGEALNRTTRRGQTELVRLFLSMNADPDAVGKDGNTPLHTACLKGMLEMAELLLQRGARVQVLSSGGTLPIHDAAVAGNGQIISLLVAKGAKSDDQIQSSGQTALHIAASWNRPDAVRALLAAGARIDIRDAKQRTAHDLASENGNAEIVTLLSTAATSSR